MIIPRFVYDEMKARAFEDGYNKAIREFEEWNLNVNSGYRARVVKESIDAFKHRKEFERRIKADEK